MSNFHFSFAPPSPDAIQFLEQETRTRFAHIDMRDWFCVTCWNDHDAVVGVLVAEPRNWFDWHLSAAVADQRMMTRRLLRTIFKTLFTRATRITALIEPDNLRSVDCAKKLGFVYEGFMRLGIEGTRDALMFGMLTDDCRWLPGHRATGTILRTDFAGAHNGLLWS
jgi:RimJ/RimL family protein N-acetyltransferase